MANVKPINVFYIQNKDISLKKKDIQFFINIDNLVILKATYLDNKSYIYKKPKLIRIEKI